MAALGIVFFSSLSMSSLHKPSAQASYTLIVCLMGCGASRAPTRRRPDATMVAQVLGVVVARPSHDMLAGPLRSDSIRSSRAPRDYMGNSQVLATSVTYTMTLLRSREYFRSIPSSYSRLSLIVDKASLTRYHLACSFITCLLSPPSLQCSYVVLSSDCRISYNVSPSCTFVVSTIHYTCRYAIVVFEQLGPSESRSRLQSRFHSVQTSF